MKQIDISTPKYPNTFTLVDDEDYDEMNSHKWHAHDNGYGKTYAMRTIRVEGKKTAIRMHSVILGNIKGKQIDHRNGITLDNQRHNLRHCTIAENQRNRRISSRSTSGYKGVGWHKGANKWIAQIGCAGKYIYLGLFTSLIEAIEIYDKAAIKYHGEFAKTNFNRKRD
jgi:hypothetical protein